MKLSIICLFHNNYLDRHETTFSSQVALLDSDAEPVSSTLWAIPCLLWRNTFLNSLFVLTEYFFLCVIGVHYIVWTTKPLSSTVLLIPLAVKEPCIFAQVLLSAFATVTCTFGCTSRNSSKSISWAFSFMFSKRCMIYSFYICWLNNICYNPLIWTGSYGQWLLIPAILLLSWFLCCVWVCLPFFFFFAGMRLFISHIFMDVVNIIALFSFWYFL